MPVICLLIVFALSSCTGMFINKYGYVSSDTKTVRNDGKVVFIPETAPSVSQGYRPEPRDDSRGIATSGHEGIDIMSKAGTPVIAAVGGTVKSSFYEPFYGNNVIISHGQDENGLFVISRYLHLKERIVKKGDRVARGQKIGTLGSTGLLASYPHLHYEIRKGARLDRNRFEHMNPHIFWVDGVGIITCFDSKREWKEKPFKTTYPVPCR